LTGLYYRSIKSRGYSKEFGLIKIAILEAAYLDPNRQSMQKPIEGSTRKALLSGTAPSTTDANLNAALPLTEDFLPKA
jgi:hypothetical protein